MASTATFRSPFQPRWRCWLLLLINRVFATTPYVTTRHFTLPTVRSTALTLFAPVSRYSALSPIPPPTRLLRHGDDGRCRLTCCRLSEPPAHRRNNRHNNIHGNAFDPIFDAQIALRVCPLSLRRARPTGSAAFGIATHGTRLHLDGKIEQDPIHDVPRRRREKYSPCAGKMFAFPSTNFVKI